MKQMLGAALAMLMLASGGNSLADTTSNLVARYTFNACNGKDATGRGHNGELTGPANCVPGPLGDNAFDFTGAGNYFTVATSTDFDVDAGLSYSVWLRPAASQTSTVLRKLVEKFEDKSLSLKSGVPSFYLYNCMSGASLVAKKAIPVNEWTHVAATYDGLTARIYVNGQLSSSKATVAGCNPADSNGAYLIAAENPGPTSFFQGAMDDLRIYQRALSSADVLQIYRDVYPPPIAGTATWGTQHTVLCENLSQGTSISIPSTKANAWDCEAAGLVVGSGDVVRVTIDGTRY